MFTSIVFDISYSKHYDYDKTRYHEVDKVPSECRQPEVVCFRFYLI